MLMEATVPSTHRWIPKAMTVSYLQKATTSLRATARIDPPDFRLVSEGTELVVPVSVTDRSGCVVVHATSPPGSRLLEVRPTRRRRPPDPVSTPESPLRACPERTLVPLVEIGLHPATVRPQ
ncbi:MAG: hypothetical protein QOI01_5992 [Mycobacterium sp.]|nr:hypothetical protein [Mycobacterium sp.]